MTRLGTLSILFVLAWVQRASAREFTARFYPEKQAYLVGEPIIVIRVVHNGSSKPIEIGESGCPDPTQFEVEGATPKPALELWGCGPKAIAGDCLVGSYTVPARGDYRKRFLLEGPFEIETPGTYHVRAKSHLGGPFDTVSEFNVQVRAPKPGELEAAYKPLFDDLHNGNDYEIRAFAAAAISQNPPKFAQSTILALADDAFRPLSLASIEGLKRLATPATRAKLLQMASTSSGDRGPLSQSAIEALGEIGNPDDCQAMLAVAAKSNDYTQEEAYVVAGHICKERAVPTLLGLAHTVAPQFLEGISAALANTGSHDAIPLLIDLLQNPDRFVRESAAQALADMTHRISSYGVEDASSARQSQAEWLSWWSLNGGTAQIFDSGQCVAPQPLR